MVFMRNNYRVQLLQHQEKKINEGEYIKNKLFKYILLSVGSIEYYHRYFMNHLFQLNLIILQINGINQTQIQIKHVGNPLKFHR
jgi:hypothetical protein